MTGEVGQTQASIDENAPGEGLHLPVLPPGATWREDSDGLEVKLGLNTQELNDELKEKVLEVVAKCKRSFKGTFRICVYDTSSEEVLAKRVTYKLGLYSDHFILATE